MMAMGMYTRAFARLFVSRTPQRLEHRTSSYAVENQAPDPRNSQQTIKIVPSNRGVGDGFVRLLP